MSAETQKGIHISEEVALLRDSARKLLRELASPDIVRDLVAGNHLVYEQPPEPKFNADLWRSMIDLGWSSLALPEKYGGSGLGAVSLAVLCEELGRASVPAPLQATLMAAVIVAGCKGEQAAELGEKIASGLSICPVFTDLSGVLPVTRSKITATDTSDGRQLTGKARFVTDAGKCEALLVIAECEGGLEICYLDKATPGVEVRQDVIVDLTRDQATIDFAGARTTLLEPAETGHRVLQAALPALLTMIAADSAGAAEHQLQSTVEYAKTRVQFGRAIGSFQAVKHPLVNMMVMIDETRALTYTAASAIDTGDPQALLVARMAKESAAETAAYCSGRSVQLHGGIGFTWESDVHIYFKRQFHNAAWLGGAQYQRIRLAESFA